MNFGETFLCENDEDTFIESSLNTTNSCDNSCESTLIDSIIRTWTMEYLWGRCKFLESSMIINAPVHNEDSIFCHLFEQLGLDSSPIEEKQSLLKKNANRMILALRERRSNCQESMKRDAIKSKSLLIIME